MILRIHQTQEMKNLFLALFLIFNHEIFAQKVNELSLSNEKIKLIWKQTSTGWELQNLSIKKNNKWVFVENPSGENTLLYSLEKPNLKSDTTFKTISGESFPEKSYFSGKEWEETTNKVSLNTAGKAFYFLPSKVTQISKNVLKFEHETDVAKIITEWSLDVNFSTDILVKQTITAKKQGYFSSASPTLSSISEQNLAWATVPGYFQGNRIQPHFVLAYAYGHGIPSSPVIYRERAAGTLSPIISTKSGITFSVIPNPNLGRNPWEKDRMTHNDWNVGLSHKNRKSELSPTLYFPILGEPKSLLNVNESITYDFRYSITDKDWFEALNHTVNDIFKFKEALSFRQSKQSLTDRIEKMHQYLTDQKRHFGILKILKALKLELNLIWEV